MIIVNTDYISGKNLETIGLVQGAAEVIAYGTAVKFI